MTSGIPNNRRFSPHQKLDALVRRAHRQWNSGELRSAFQLFLSAAKQGESSAQLDLGYFYDVGIGVARNRSAAIRWCRCAFRNGIAGGANNIGTIYRDEGDAKRALFWFERAGRLGDIDANLEVAKIRIQLDGGNDGAIPYLKRIAAAEAGAEVTQFSHEQALRLSKSNKPHSKKCPIKSRL